jgi:hypothetical protein
MEKIADIDINYFYHKNIIKNISDRNNVRDIGKNKLNKFSNLDVDDRIELGKQINKIFGLDYRWTFDYCYTPEPVGLHNDYEPTVMNGIIIPLDWNIKQPYTLTFDKETHDGKVVYRNGNVIYKDSEQIIQYKTDATDNEISKYMPDSQQGIYNGLKLHNVFKWEVGKVFLFEANRWHTSSWFSGYKSFINGFGRCTS